MSTVEKIESVSLGEFRMGCEGYGLIISTTHGIIDVFKDEIISVNSQDSERIVMHSKCDDFLLINGEFDQYIVDIKGQRISVYRTTIRTSGIWSEEIAIFGKEKTHINGFSRHYYLQFPFVIQQDFKRTLSRYKSLREQQLLEMESAL
ncbi:hypothetical protein [Vibrio aestuarianus]|uniref:YokE-like PH domain-containing protein n=1 Tax=Vibrio aestuarianus TaxID=28171 RepID=A0ABD7YQG1_9VIBR|nr:hypothetical protein [Vibrio aestuarianus]WGK87332.1 hypothetical protein PYE67_14510 [Vibrio aestuarianus]CAH8188420.1 hypothetical protein VAEU17_1430003 [Vibrio aestuarianus]